MREELLPVLADGSGIRDGEGGGRGECTTELLPYLRKVGRRERRREGGREGGRGGREGGRERREGGEEGGRRGRDCIIDGKTVSDGSL